MIIFYGGILVLFNSLAFAVFMPIVFFVYWLVPQKFKWAVLLISSYYYYMSWGAEYAIWIVLTTLISYFGALGIEKFSDEKKKKVCLVLPVVFTLGTLVFFKYFNFISSSVTTALRSFSLPVSDLTLNLIMPLGISFYSFQTVAYLVDVYNGKSAAQKHIGKYALFISFFPQVLSGPIARANDLMPQLEEPKKFDYEQVSYGARQMAWGFFKKMVVSSVCAGYADGVYNSIPQKTGFVLVLATVLYALQIYCDFSGYSDIAIGTARLLGINLKDNFKNPYMAQSIKEFWGRWHISLSTWFRDYVYIPLGGNRVSKFRYACNIIITFLVSGLWHGAAWTFIIWGLLHGVLQVVETFVYKTKAFSKLSPFGKEKKVFSVKGIITLVLTFSIVCFTWIFFRANSLNDALFVIKNSFVGIASPINYIKRGVSALGLSNEGVLRLVPSVATVVLTEFLSLKWDLYKKVGEIKPIFKWIIYIVVLVMIVVLTPSNANQDFIYFQF